MAGTIPMTGASRTTTPTSFQFLMSVKSEYSGWVWAVPDSQPAALSSAAVYPPAGFAAAGSGDGGVSAMTESNFRAVLPRVPSVQCAAVTTTVGLTRVAEQR